MICVLGDVVATTSVEPKRQQTRGKRPLNGKFGGNTLAPTKKTKSQQQQRQQQQQ
jgi:hypothetical protein